MIGSPFQLCSSYRMSVAILATSPTVSRDFHPQVPWSFRTLGLAFTACSSDLIFSNQSKIQFIKIKKKSKAVLLKLQFNALKIKKGLRSCSEYRRRTTFNHH